MGRAGAAAGVPSPAGAGAPIFVLCTARSGSTLLRVILDSHSTITCPQELNLSEVCSHLYFAWNALALSGEEDAECRRRARDECRSVCENLMSHVLARSGKSRWCDKSLSTAGHAQLMWETFPDAKFVALHRHPMDVVLSAVEASPWGYGAHGLVPYIQANPGNFVAGLLLYWRDVTTAMLAFEHAHPACCFRLRYEDLVHDPERRLKELFVFLDAEWEPEVVERAFLDEHPESGFGDQKIWFTSSIVTASVGGGRRVPIDMVPSGLLEDVNLRLAALGYPNMTDGWNEEPSNLRHRGAAGAPPCGRCDAVENGVVRLVRESLAGAEWPAGARPRRCALAIDDLPPCCGEWVIDTAARTVARAERAAPEPDHVLRADLGALGNVLAGGVDLSGAISRGLIALIRVDGEPPLSRRQVRDFLHAVFG